MKIFRCGIEGCSNYISEDEVKKVWYNKKIINICDLCDDGSLEPVKTQGENHESFKKIEKIRRNKRNQYND